MTRRTQGQPSILSFFHKQQQPPKYAAPPPSQVQQPPLQPPPQATIPPPPPSLAAAAAAAAAAATTPPAAPPSPQLPTAPARPSTADILPPALIATARSTAIPCPHPSASILPVTESHIPALRRINALLLPVNYSDSFYQGLLDPAVSGLFSRAILWQDDSTAPKVVGGLICRLEPSPFDPSTGRYKTALAAPRPVPGAPNTGIPAPQPGQHHALYIQSLVLLAPYRGLGLVGAALEGIVDTVRAACRAGAGAIQVDWVYAHVWTENEDGMGWYGRRGFLRDGLLKGYYWRLDPDSAYVVKRSVAADGSRAAQDTGGAGRQAERQAVDIPASVTAAAVNLAGFAATGTAAAAAAASVPPPSVAAGPPQPTAMRPPAPASSLSFQNKRPDMEWNDLPDEMVSSKNSSRSDLLRPPSGSSSRSSSTGRRKKDRAYPTAAFGGN